MLNEVLLSRRRILNLILSILKLDCTCFEYAFFLLLFKFLNKCRLVVVFQLLRKISLYLLCGCWVVKLVRADVEVSLSQIWRINRFVRNFFSILGGECYIIRCFFCEGGVTLANRKVSSSSSLSKWFAITLLVIDFRIYNARKVLLSCCFRFEICGSLWQSPNRKIGGSGLPLFGGPLFLWLIDSCHLGLASEWRLFAFQVFLFQQHHF